MLTGKAGFVTNRVDIAHAHADARTTQRHSNQFSLPKPNSCGVGAVRTRLGMSPSNCTLLWRHSGHAVGPGAGP